MIKVKTSFLELVHPPMSNQEAVWAPNDPELIEVLRESDFYMIAGRMSGQFSDFAIDDHWEKFSFNFRIGNRPKNPVELDLRNLPGMESYFFQRDMYSLPGMKVPTEAGLVIEEGPLWIAFWTGTPKKESSTLHQWFSTEKLLWARSHGWKGITGLDNYRQLATYDLLYVGIATEQDSYARLIEKGHHARQKILSNEPQRYPGARVTDEIFLFLFRVNSMGLKVWKFEEVDENFGSQLGEHYIDQKAVVRDAEKAFVSLLQPNYNTQRFASYPKGKDGLYGSDFTRYTYVIAENICFRTAHGEMRGGYDPLLYFSNDADYIFVEGDTVNFFRGKVEN